MRNESGVLSEMAGKVKRAAGLFALLLACGLCGAAQADIANDGPRELLRLLNRSRAEAGLAPVAWDDRLAAAAQSHAELMARNSELAHLLPGELPLRQRLKAVLLRHSAENVAVDYDVASVHVSFMNSAPHRGNILDGKFNAVGVGLASDGERIWVVEDFAERYDEYPAEVAVVKVADAFDRARREARAPNLTRSIDQRMSALACDMLRKNHLEVNEALMMPKVRYATAYTAIDIEKLAASAVGLRDKRDVTRYAVGVCFDRTPEYPSGAYWVLLVLFAN